jgi:hypothetical protein
MSDLVDKTNGSPIDTANSKYRESEYQCRLPPELMTKIFEILAHDKSLGTLAELQFTSSAIYSIATRYLYRHIIVNQVQTLTLFSLFETFPLIDNALFLEKVVPSDTHLLDLHIVYRLRSFFSFTQEMSITIDPDRKLDERYISDHGERLNRYKQVAVGLLAFSGPLLWPSLRLCTIDINSPATTPNTKQSRKHGLDPKEYESLFEAVPANMRPSKMSVILPGYRVSEYEDDHIYWGECIYSLEAENIELYIIDDENDAIPRSTSTFSIRFRSTKYSDYGLNDIAYRLESFFFGYYHNYRDIHTLRIIGILPGPKSREVVTAAQVLELMESTIEYWMKDRLNSGNLDPVKIAILSDPSPEGEAAAVWRTYHQPEVQADDE